MNNNEFETLLKTLPEEGKPFAIDQSETPEIDKSDFILLHEWNDLIAKTQKRAAIAESALNELFAIAGIKTLEALKAAQYSHGLKSFVPTEMLKDKKIRELSQIVPVENMIVPLPLQRAAILLEKEIDTAFMEFNESNEWEINLELLEDFCDKQFRTYATTAAQLKKFHLIKAVTDFLNTELTIGENTGTAFLSILIDRDADGFKPNKTFVLGGNKTEFVN